MIDKNDKDEQIYALRHALERIVEKTSNPLAAGYDEQNLYDTKYVDIKCPNDVTRIAETALFDTTF